MWAKAKLSRFKLATLTALQTGRPLCLTDLIQFHTTPKSTRSSSTQLLFVPRHNLSFGSRAIRVSIPKVWNTLPLHIGHSQSLSTFRRHLKTHYFQLASCHLESIHQRALILFIQTLTIYKSFTCLLTYLFSFFHTLHEHFVE